MTGDPAPPGRDAAHAVLSAERRRTAGRIAGLTRDFDAIVASAADASVDDEHDPEGSTIAFERAQVAALLDQARTHLAALEHAFQRLAEGTYGRCERCGGPIPGERLRARPTARTCVACGHPRRRRRP